MSSAHSIPWNGTTVIIIVVHNSYGRIDYFFESQSLLDVPIQTSIGHLLWLNHAPMHFALEHMPKSRRGFPSRLNDSLLKDTHSVAKVKLSIQNYVLDHSSDDTSNPMTQWEALKCVICSVFIKHGSLLKKACAMEIGNCCLRSPRLKTHT